MTRVYGAVLLLALWLLAPIADARSAGALPGFLGSPDGIAPGVDLYRVDARDLTDPASPQSIRLLRLDPRRVRLGSALATGEVPARATVQAIALRTHALAAVNAGFFSPAGDPTGVLRIDGRLLSDTGRARGAVALTDGRDGMQARFDRVRAHVRLRFRAGGAWRTVPIDGVDTTRGQGRLVLYSPASGATTDTTGGLEWVLTGTPLRASRPSSTGNSTIPARGYVLSYGGTTVPSLLGGLRAAPSIQVRETLDVPSGRAVRDWIRAPTIVGGAGLLVREGQRVVEWDVEQLSRGFDTTRHPRTVIARDRDGAIWLLTIDGRQPERALGMTFVEMQALLARLDVVDALNLDGGGSTTMVVGEAVVNRPSDITGPRAVSDALVVHAR